MKFFFTPGPLRKPSTWKNVDLSLWGKQNGIFPRFSSFCYAYTKEMERQLLHALRIRIYSSCLFTFLRCLFSSQNSFQMTLLPSISSLIGLDKPSSSSWRSSIIWFWGLLSFSLKKISFLQRVNPRKLAEIYFFVEAGRSIYYLLLHSPIILLSPFKKKN